MRCLGLYCQLGTAMLQSAPQATPDQILSLVSLRTFLTHSEHRIKCMAARALCDLALTRQVSKFTRRGKQQDQAMAQRMQDYIRVARYRASYTIGQICAHLPKLVLVWMSVNICISAAATCCTICALGWHVEKQVVTSPPFGESTAKTSKIAIFPASKVIFSLNNLVLQRAQDSGCVPHPAGGTPTRLPANDSRPSCSRGSRREGGTGLAAPVGAAVVAADGSVGRFWVSCCLAPHFCDLCQHSGFADCAALDVLIICASSKEDAPRCISCS